MIVVFDVIVNDVVIVDNDDDNDDDDDDEEEERRRRRRRRRIVLFFFFFRFDFFRRGNKMKRHQLRNFLWVSNPSLERAWKYIPTSHNIIQKRKQI